MNIFEPKTLTYFTQNDEELREKKKLAISEMMDIQKNPGVIVVGCREDMYDAILDILMIHHSPHLTGKTILVVEAGQTMGNIGEFVVPEELKIEAQIVKDMTMIIQSYKEECGDILLEKTEHSYKKHTHHYPIGKPQKSKAAKIRYQGTRNK